MNVEGNISGYTFAGNPLWVSETLGDYENGARRRFFMEHTGAVVFRSNFTHPLRINISDILKALAGDYPKPPANRGAFFVLEDAQTLADRRTVQFWLEDEPGYETVQRKSVVVLPGALPRQNYRVYSEAGSDVFASRFLANDRNFLFTARSADWEVVIPEGEVAPLYFLAKPGETFELRGHFSDEGITADGVADGGGVIGLDLMEGRKELVNLGIVDSVFDLYRNGVLACRLVLEMQLPVVDSCRVAFRNCYGVFEVLTLEGPMERSLTHGEEDEENWRDYDGVLDDFALRAFESTTKVTLKGKTRVLRSWEMPMVGALLASQEVYLLDVAPSPLRVIPRAEELRKPVRFVAPERVDISFDVCEDIDAFAPDITGVDSGKRPRIFNNRFNNKFN